MKATPLTLAATFAALANAQAQERPNILVILCDDLGYGDLACYGQQRIATPHIDRLARQGVRFTQAYAGSPVSAPSRATLMTGQHTGHTHVRGNREYWGRHFVDSLYGRHREVAEGWAGQEPYAADRPILSEILHCAGYATGLFGKWAGGYEGSHSLPHTRGFDEFLGFVCQYQAHAYYPNFLNAFSRAKGDTATHRVVLHENIPYGMPGESDYTQRPAYAADIIHRAALSWLDQQQEGKPFFGLFTYTLPHAELVQPDDSLVAAYRHHLSPERSYKANIGARYHGTDEGHAQFAAMVTRLDQMVGEIGEKLRQKGLEHNTLVVFTSDNGPHEEGGADPAFFNRDGLLRGTKRAVLEGGIRVPFIVKWPARVEAGRASDFPLAFWDLLPTFAEAAGVSSDALPSTDGYSCLPHLTGRDAEQQRHEHFYWEFHETDQIAVRRGDWKLVVVGGRPSLYNINDDPHEDHDRAKEQPEILQQLIDIVHQEHQPNNLFPVTLPERAQ